MSGPVYGGGARSTCKPSPWPPQLPTPATAAAATAAGQPALATLRCWLRTALRSDEVNAIVLDIGTHAVKAGYAGEDTPKYVFPSVRLVCSLACLLPWRHAAAAAAVVCMRCMCLLSMPMPVLCQPSLGCCHPPFAHASVSACICAFQSVGAIGGGPDGMEVDGAKRTLYVGTHSLAHRRDGMEVRDWL